jgi:hypothetical protein
LDLYGMAWRCEMTSTFDLDIDCMSFVVQTLEHQNFPIPLYYIP